MGATTGLSGAGLVQFLALCFTAVSWMLFKTGPYDFYDVVILTLSLCCLYSIFPAALVQLTARRVSG